MPYLERRIRQLVDDLHEGRVTFAEGRDDRLIEEIRAVQFGDDGRPDLATCSPFVRSFARAYAAASAGLAQQEGSDDLIEKTSPPKSASEVAALNRDLFGHFADVFQSFTGTSAARFTRSGESFGAAIARLGETMRRRPSFGKELFRRGNDALARLQTHYAKSKNERLSASASCIGAKFVLAGGTATFLSSQAAAARSMLLYCDTLLIPDPVLAWLEVERPEEAFPHVRMLENMWHLLSFAPLVEAELPYPALIVFPSWEKLMEKHDEVTRDGQELLALRFFSHFLDGAFDDMSEVVDRVRRDPIGFLSVVERKQLFVAPGGAVGEPLLDGLKRYREQVTRWRTEGFRERVLSLSDAELSFGAIVERLAPQFHARDNAEALAASPLFSLPANWHYFELLHDATRPQSDVPGTAPTRAAAGLSNPAHR